MAEHPNDPLIGQRFHDYQIEKKLAQGGMGAVYLLRHVELPDVLKVLKVIAPWALERPSPNDRTGTRRMVEFRRSFLVARFEQEAAAISRLSHPNILPIPTRSDVQNFVYFASSDDSGEALDEDHALAALLDTGAGHGIRGVYQPFPTTSHVGSVLVGVIDGLRQLFAGYAVPTHRRALSRSPSVPARAALVE